MPNALSAARLQSPGRGGLSLAIAGLAATLASGCCVLPLVLAVIGVSGAWISSLRVLAPYSNALIGVALLLLGTAGWQLYRSPKNVHASAPADDAAMCVAADNTCATTRPVARRWFWFVLLLTLIPIAVPLLAPLFY